MGTPPARGVQLGGFTNTYGTQANPHTFAMPAGSQSLVAASVDYVFSVPFYRTNAGVATKNMYISISRGGYTLTFHDAEVVVPASTVVWNDFALSNQQNLFAPGISGDFIVTFWCNPTDDVIAYIQSNTVATLTAIAHGTVAGMSTCVLHYIP